MCDTFIAMQPERGGFIFGKNSDREPDEGQSVVYFPRTKWVDVRLRCTYINIPQVRETFAVWLSRPYHIWGAEMGVNEFGLTIGNEAVFTKVPFAKKDNGLTGMDCVRLALERCNNAFAAVNLICYMLETYGQDACGGYRNRNFYYHNSFLIADRQDAYILESVDRAWAVKKVGGRASISNGLTITDDYDFISVNAKAIATENKLKVKEGESINFQTLFTDKFYTKFSRCSTRQQTTHKAVSQQNFSTVEAMQTLKSHHQPLLGTFRPRGGNTSDVCMHATNLLNPSSTTGSMVVDVSQEKIIIWLTTTAYPCISVYIPFFFEGADTSEAAMLNASPRSDASIWWLHQEFYQLLRKRNGRKEWPGAKAAEEINALQRQVIEGVLIPENQNFRYTISMLKLYNNKLKEWTSSF